MNVFRKWLTAVFLLGTVLTGTIAVSASGFEFASDQVPDQARIIENVNFTVSDTPPRQFAVVCFDVNTDGRIAIGTENGETKIISIYDRDGIYQYGFTYQSSGTFGLEWDNQDLLVYSVRSDLAFRISPTGVVIEIQKIADTMENNTYWHNVVFARERTLGDERYCLRNDMGILNFLKSSYSQLMLVQADGTERILYDVNTQEWIKTAMILMTFLIFASVSFLAIYKNFRKLKRVQGI